MKGAAFLYRIQSLKIQGMQIPQVYSQYCPDYSQLLEI
jgi:trans-AT polyketide synthase/acyltransferase/oxidoreductase domain-containing protein